MLCYLVRGCGSSSAPKNRPEGWAGEQYQYIRGKKFVEENGRVEHDNSPHPLSERNHRTQYGCPLEKCQSRRHPPHNGMTLWRTSTPKGPPKFITAKPPAKLTVCQQEPCISNA
ncbi:hypothetical protein JTE90_025208 [Oedothorax gibbosus]|uniref:Uncharacterized protein n=1 Tax=Oedothorax gibbosus TaxID=931172 RepID=A0AAV6UT80_9ARAC|nr:hypothetical protein JTE90_025208 [Oedothorax gibbosus]